MLQRNEKIFVHQLGLIVARRLQTRLLLETPSLIDGIIQLGIGVGELERSGDERLEPLYEARLPRLEFGQG